MKVGFIGLGTIGKPMAANIVRAGFELVVYDLRLEPLKELNALGATVAQSPKDAAEHAEIIALAVVDDSQVERVLAGKDGVFEGIRPDSIVAIHSTISPATVQKIADLGRPQRVGLLDAPVSGGQQGARDRALCCMVGGEKQLLERCQPVLRTSASRIYHMGALGTGATAKLILQVVVCINMLAAHEAEALCEKTGLDFSVFQDLTHYSSGQSFVVDHWLDRFKRPDDPVAVRLRRTDVFQKSLSPALQLAQELDISIPGAALVQSLLPRIMGTDKKGLAGD